MKKTYSIEVDCANCANLMEEATKKTAGVANATVSIETAQLSVDLEALLDKLRMVDGVKRLEVLGQA